MPIYKRAPNKYCVRIYLNGKPRDWIVNGTKGDAELFEAKQRSEMAAEGPREYRAAPSFYEFLRDEYRPYAEPRLGKRTWQGRAGVLATLTEHFGKTALNKFTAADFYKYQTERGKAVGPVRVNDELRHMCTALNYARKLKLSVVVPDVEDLPEPRERGKVRAWTDQDIKKLYAAIQKEADSLLGIVATLLNTGMRRGEVLALEWNWVDIDRRLIFIQPNEFWRPKDNEPREVSIADVMLPWLKVDEKDRDDPVYVFPARRRKRKDPKTGEPRWTSGGRYKFWPQRKFDRAVKLAGLKGGPHMLRHTYASHFLKAVPDLELLAKVLGHADTRTTKIYTHFMPDHLERARNAVNIGPGPAVVPDAPSRKSKPSK